MNKTPITMIVMTKDKYIDFMDMPTRERWIPEGTSFTDGWGHTYVYFKGINAMTAAYIHYHFGIKDNQPIQL